MILRVDRSSTVPADDRRPCSGPTRPRRPGEWSAAVVVHALNRARRSGTRRSGRRPVHRGVCWLGERAGPRERGQRQHRHRAHVRTRSSHRPPVTGTRPTLHCHPGRFRSGLRAAARGRSALALSPVVAPAPPAQESDPNPPSRLSLPASPNSRPSPPWTVSLPPYPWIVSRPPSPRMTSPSVVEPKIKSSYAYPRTCSTLRNTSYPESPRASRS